MCDYGGNLGELRGTRCGQQDGCEEARNSKTDCCGAGDLPRITEVHKMGRIWHVLKCSLSCNCSNTSKDKEKRKAERTKTVGGWTEPLPQSTRERRPAIRL